MNDDQFNYQVKKKGLLFGSMLLMGILDIIYFRTKK